jgi:hypothetical protein
MNLFNNPKLSAPCRFRFGAVEERPGRCGILPGACARSTRSRVERSAAHLLGCDPGNLALRRRGMGTGGTLPPVSVPRRAPRSTVGDSRQRIGDGGRIGLDLDRANRSDAGSGATNGCHCNLVHDWRGISRAFARYPKQILRPALSWTVCWSLAGTARSRALQRTGVCPGRLRLAVWELLKMTSDAVSIYRPGMTRRHRSPRRLVGSFAPATDATFLSQEPP